MTVSTNSFIKEVEIVKNWPQIVAILLSSFVAFNSGYIYAWPSPYLPKITQDKDNYNISQNEASYFTIAHALGMFVLPVFIVPVPNTIGRKRTIQLSVLPYIVCFLVKIFAKNVWLFYFARFCAGAGDAMVFSALPSYIGEISTPEIRGVWGNSFTVSMFLGQFVINIVGSYVTVQEASYIGLTIPLLSLATFSFMPQSPYFLVMKGYDDKAKESLRWLRRKKDVEFEFSVIKISVRKQMEEPGSWKDLVTIKANRAALLSGVFLRLSQLLSGVYVFASYTQFIFEKAGGNISAQTSAIFYTGLTAFMYTCCSYVSNMMGRRKAFMISIVLAGIVVLVEAIYFYIDQEYKDIDLVSFKWFPLVGMLVFVTVSSFGVGIVPTLMLGELFATNIKSKGIGLVTCVFAGGIVITNNIFYYFNANTGLYGPFFLFGACNIMSAFISYYIVPETKGKTLDEIQAELRNM